MSRTLRLHPAVRKDLRRLSPEARNFILGDTLPVLGRDPLRGEPLHGPLKGLRKLQVGELRIAYAVDEQRHELLSWKLDRAADSTIASAAVFGSNNRACNDQSRTLQNALRNGACE